MSARLPTPPEIFRLFEEGKLTREQLHAAMNQHAYSIMEEIVEARRNPVLSFYEYALSRRAAARLEREYGEGTVRSVLVALSELPGFALRNYLWNAGHRDVPLHCFLRQRTEPVFRLLEIKLKPWRVMVTVEYGSARKGEALREVIALQRDRFGRLAPAQSALRAAISGLDDARPRRSDR
jgi:hypothetical protein